MTKKHLIILLICVCGFSMPCVGQGQGRQTRQMCLHIGPVVQELEVMLATTPQQKEKGLMFWYYLPYNRGMLFSFNPPQPVFMWMKNTLLPLDMVFLDKAGNILSIKKGATPLSPTIISEKRAVSSVLEVMGGFFKYHNLGKKGRLTFCS